MRHGIFHKKDIIIIIYLICWKTGWHQKVKPVLGCFPNKQYKKKQ